MYEVFEEGKTNGFEFLPGFIEARHTALDVVDQYYFGKKQGVFSREDETRWLQIEGKLTGATLQLFREIEKKVDSLLRCHIYANWIRNGNLGPESRARERLQTIQFVGFLRRIRPP